MTLLREALRSYARNVCKVFCAVYLRPMQYISVKGDVILLRQILMQSSYSIELNQRSDASHGVYQRAEFMTIFAQYPQGII